MLNLRPNKAVRYQKVMNNSERRHIRLISRRRHSQIIIGHPGSKSIIRREESRQAQQFHCPIRRKQNWHPWPTARNSLFSSLLKSQFILFNILFNTTQVLVYYTQQYKIQINFKLDGPQLLNILSCLNDYTTSVSVFCCHRLVLFINVPTILAIIL